MEQRSQEEKAAIPDSEKAQGQEEASQPFPKEEQLAGMGGKP